MILISLGCCVDIGQNDCKSAKDLLAKMTIFRHQHVEKLFTVSAVSSRFYPKKLFTDTCLPSCTIFLQAVFLKLLGLPNFTVV